MYHTRKAEAKYSYLASLSEIKRNDCILNIPHYVDTFEEDEPVDLTAVVQEIKKIDADMVETDQKIKAFYDELGIEVPV